MQCPRCQSTQLRKNGMSAGKQRYLCRNCGKTFFSSIPSEHPLEINPSAKDSQPLNPPGDVASQKPSATTSATDSLPGFNHSSSEDLLETLAIHKTPQTESHLKSESWEGNHEVLSKVGVAETDLYYQEILTLYQNLEANFLRLFQKKEEAGIAILLLDVENIQLTVKAEKFLINLCRYPLQIKIAFGNWRKLANWDEEFHGRGYQMIHVPGGKDSADAKMTAVGSSIFLQYPNVKEVLVCSSDWGLTHLYNYLQIHGVVTYLVKENKEEKKVIVSSSKSDKIEVYSLLLSQSVPSLEDFLESIQEIINQQQTDLNKAWISLDSISDLHYQKTGFTVAEVLQKHCPGKHLAEFLQESGRFAFHQPRGQETLFITLFQVPSPQVEDSPLKNGEELEIIQVETLKLEPSNSTPANSISETATDANATQKKSTSEGLNQQTLAQSKIQSISDLEQLLLELLKTLTNHEPEKYVQLGMLGTAFRNLFEEPISTTMKRLQVTGNFIKFIQARPHLFKLKKNNNQNHVSINPD